MSKNRERELSFQTLTNPISRMTDISQQELEEVNIASPSRCHIIIFPYCYIAISSYRPIAISSWRHIILSASMSFGGQNSSAYYSALFVSSTSKLHLKQQSIILILILIIILIIVMIRLSSCLTPTVMAKSTAKSWRLLWTRSVTMMTMVTMMLTITITKTLTTSTMMTMMTMLRKSSWFSEWEPRRVQVLFID